MNNRKKIWLTFLGILVIGILAGLVSWPKGPDISIHKWGIDYDKELKIHLGLDLQGGTHLVYQADLSQIKEKDYSEAMEGVRDVIERRVNMFGVSEPVIQIAQKDRLIVELAGVKDISKAIKMIGDTPSLDFREEISEEELKEIIKSSGQEVPKEMPSGPYFKPTGLSGKQLNRADISFDPQTHEPEVILEFNDEGKKLFAEITERNVQKIVAIYLDNVPISTPVVQEPIRDGRAVISGKFTLDEAKLLVRRLNAGALPVPIKLISQQTIGASLGKDSLQKSLLAGIIGLIILAFFLIIYYRLPGLLAVIALGLYILIVISLFKLIPVVLTLAGTAGFILSIGMAVDANVLIFERMKEELRSGKSLGVAIEEGFKRAWSSIRDSNASTLIVCAILFGFGTGLIKGFALTLGIGIVMSMFSAIIITRTFLRIFATAKMEKRLWLFGVKK